MNDNFDLLAYFDGLVAAHCALSADAYHAQEHPKAVLARSAIAELLAAANHVLDKEWEYGDEQPHCARLAVALARIGAAK